MCVCVWGGGGGRGVGRGCSCGEIVSDLKQNVESPNDYFVSAGNTLNGRFPASTPPIQTTPQEADSVFKFTEISIKAV